MHGRRWCRLWPGLRLALFWQVCCGSGATQPVRIDPLHQAVWFGHINMDDIHGHGDLAHPLRATRKATYAS